MRAWVRIGVLGLVASAAAAQSVTLEADEQPPLRDFNWLPFGFFSESFGVGVGVGAVFSGWPEEVSSVLGACTVGTEGSYTVAGAISDLRVPGTRRLYANPRFLLGRYQDQILFIGRQNAGFEGERAGANDSEAANHVEATQWDNWAELELRYLLPLGHGRDDARIVSRYVVDRGLLQSGASGGDAWNPLASGRTVLSWTPQWRNQTLERDDQTLPLETWNVETGLEYCNFDFPANPTRGSLQRVAYKRDFSDHHLLGGWDRWTFEWTKVFDLGAGERTLQRVLALDVWSAYVPSWETETVDGEEIVVSRPPPYDSAALGGVRRMRAYEDDRFHDKAAIYYSVEYRVIPRWQPLRGMRELRFADPRFWQWVLFVEAGQVSPSWNVAELHADLHVDGGISLRGMLHTALCRLDVAVGEEGTRVTAMYGHPF